MIDTCGDGLGGPAVKGFEVAVSDGSDLPFYPRALYVGVAGNVTVVMKDDTTLGFVGVTAGSFLPIRPKRVKSTGTTATNIIALY